MNNKSLKILSVLLIIISVGMSVFFLAFSFSSMQFDYSFITPSKEDLGLLSIADYIRPLVAILIFASICFIDKSEKIIPATILIFIVPEIRELILVIHDLLIMRQGAIYYLTISFISIYIVAIIYSVILYLSKPSLSDKAKHIINMIFVLLFSIIYIINGVYGQSFNIFLYIYYILALFIVFKLQSTGNTGDGSLC